MNKNKKKMSKCFDNNTLKSHISIFSKVIIVILVIGMLINHINVSIFASLINEEKNYTVSIDTNSNSDNDYSKLANVSEIESLRTENSKTYLKVNGMYETEYYNEKIHYQVNNEFKEIDNTLEYNSEKQEYKNKSNRFDITFPKNLNNEKSIKLNYLSNYIKIYYDDIDNINATKTNSGKIQNESKLLKDSINYVKNKNEIINYEVMQDSIKENIILASYIENYTYSYIIETKLRIERIFNELYFYDEDNNNVFIMNEYYMYDFNGNKSYDIEFNITNIGDYKYRINVSPSDEFLKEASYPVVIDPVIKVTEGGEYEGVFTVDIVNHQSNSIDRVEDSTFTISSGNNNTTEVDDDKAYLSIIMFPSMGGFSKLKTGQLMYANIELRALSATNTNNAYVELREVFLNEGFSYINYLYTNTFEVDYVDKENLYNTTIFDHKFDIFNTLKRKLNNYTEGSISLDFELSVQSNQNTTVTYFNSYDLTGDLEDNTIVKPALCVGYLDEAGIKDYFTYENLNISDEADVYIAHNSGNLSTVFNDYSGGLINLSHIYNDNRKHNTSYYGNGFNINYHEKIEKLSNTSYILTEGDGNEILYYYNQSLNASIDTSGGKSEFRVISTGYEIESDDDVLKRYDSDGLLTKIIFDSKDEDSDYIDVVYDFKDRLYRVRASNGDYIAFEYNSTTLLLDKIKVYKHNSETNQNVFYYSLSYNYSNNLSSSGANNLVTITKSFNDTTSLYVLQTGDVQLSLTYDSSKHITKIHKNNLGYTFVYDTLNRVTKAKVYNNTITNTAFITFLYDTNGYKTIIKDHNNKTNTYTFDSEYHTNSIEDSNYNIRFYKYEDIYFEEDGDPIADIKYDRRHTLKVQSNSFKNDVNIITNHGFEVEESNDVIYGWTKDLGNGDTASINNSVVLYGSNVLEINRTSNTIARVYQEIEVELNKEYTVTCFIKNENTNGNGAYLYVDGVYEEAYPVGVTQAKVKESSGFIKYTYKFRSPISNRVRIVLANESTGSAYFDNVQISSEYIDTRYNYLENSSFENDDFGWDNTDLYIQDINSEVFNENCGNYMLCLPNEEQATQTLNIVGSKGDIFVFGGYCFYDNYKGSVKVTLTIEYINGENVVEYFIFDDSSINARFYLSKLEAKESYNRVVLKIENLSHYSYAYLDNMAIYKEGYGVNIKYNDDGLLTEQYNEITKEKVEYQYDNNSNKLTNIKTNKSDITLNYNSEKENQIDSIENKNINTSFAYDSHNNVISSVTSDTLSNKKYYSNIKTYSSDGLYLEQESSILGSYLNYTYDSVTGLVDYIVDQNGVKTDYVYTDDNKNIENVVITKGQTNKTVTYTYDDYDRVETITSGSLTYTLVYNDYGDLISVKLNNNTLVTYDYLNDESDATSIYESELNSIAYQYGTVSFEYDDNKNIKNIKFNNELLYEYYYNDYNEIASYKDCKENVTYYYNYDYLNRLINVSASNGNNFSYEYDSDSNLVSKENITGEFTYAYTDFNSDVNKEDKLITSENINDLYVIGYTYESSSFRSLQAINFYINNHHVNVTYVEETKPYNGNTYYTGRIKEIRYSEFVNDNNNDLFRIVYDYDSNSNIVSVIKYQGSNTVYYEYNTYDIFNQLTSQRYLVNGIEYTKTFTYDNIGNITSYTLFDTTYDDFITSVTYTYNYNSNRLTKVNIAGEEYNIEYNSYGQVTSYLGYSISYDGNNISVIQNDSLGSEYRYNADGIRTYKGIFNFDTMSLTEVEYTLEGDLIIKEKRTGNSVYEIEYYYDSNGSISGFNYNGNTYIYLKNLQNDIIGIVDNSGEIVVEYYYDAYGNIIKMVDTSELDIGNINPFRYRSYYYDKETGWYYLNSRYYNPLLCRFITMDSVEYLGASGSMLSLNLYAYCENNPIMYVDPTGHDKEDWIIRFVFGLFTDLVLEKEPREAAKEYEENVIELGITENMIVLDNNLNSIKINGSDIGKIINKGSYEIDNSYTYSSQDMQVICLAIAKHMGDESQANRLYEEWMAHNYGYFVFSYNGLYSKASSFIGVDGAEACKNVNFGIEPETGIRRIVLEIIYYYGSR